VSRLDKYSEKAKWERAWSEVGLEDEIRNADCPLHPKGRAIFLAGYQLKYPDGTVKTMAAGWVCSTCYSLGRVPVRVYFKLDGSPDLNTVEWATIRKLSAKEYAEMTKHAGAKPGKPDKSLP
jgi:hypothetical protein